MRSARDRKSCITGSKEYLSIDPVFKRNGKYAKGDKAWFEVDGKAWTYSIKMFQWEIATLEAERLNARQVSALKAVCENKLATKQQAQLLYMYNHAQELREIRRGVM